MLRIEVLSDRTDHLGEGPLWDVTEQRLYRIDSYGPAILSCDAAGGDRHRWRLPEPIGSMALRAKDGAILALRDGFYSFDFASGAAERIVQTQPGELRLQLTTAIWTGRAASSLGRWISRKSSRSANCSGSTRISACMSWIPGTSVRTEPASAPAGGRSQENNLCL